MAYTLFFVALAYLMVGGNFGEGPSTRSKQQVKTLWKSGALNPLYWNESHTKDGFNDSLIVYENKVDMQP